MPIVFTFDISGAPSPERNRIQSFFERFGWERLGGSAYRYPGQEAEQEEVTEDWFNHVIPALMLFRAYVVDSGRNLARFTLDVQSSTSMNDSTRTGIPPLPSDEIGLYGPSNVQFGESNLLNWLGGVTYPYDVGD